MIVLLILAAAALAATAWLVAAALRPASVVAFALACWLVAAGEIVLLTEVLSPLHLARGWGYGAGEAVLLAAAAHQLGDADTLARGLGAQKGLELGGGQERHTFGFHGQLRSLQSCACVW